MKFFEKVGSFTEHGSIIDAGKAMAYDELAASYGIANERNPGMAYIKGTYLKVPIYQLLARKNAYKSHLTGLSNIKGLIPFVGMGRAGEKALEEENKRYYEHIGKMLSN